MNTKRLRSFFLRPVSTSSAVILMITLLNVWVFAKPACAELTFSKAFSPDTIPPGGTSTLTFTIDNTTGTQIATELNFTDDLPAGVFVADPPNALKNCTGSLTAEAGSGIIGYSGGPVAAGESCTIQVDVTCSILGFHRNYTNLEWSGGRIFGDATLTVMEPPAFSKAFTPDTILPGGTSTLTFTIDNAGPWGVTNLAFTDNLPDGVDVATPPNASSTCPDGTLTANAGSGTISYDSDGWIFVGESCTIKVDVTSSTPGTHVNTTGDLTSSQGNSGPATASLTVGEKPAAIPALSEWGVMIMLLLTITASLVVIRRRLA